MTELTIRHCDIYERLFDMKIKFEVKQNSQPVFVSRLQSQFQVKLNKSLAYELPDIVDPQGNANPQILFEPLTGFERLYPPFLIRHNENRTIEFVADKDEYGGRQYFFQLVLKEEGEGAIGFPYYIKVFVEEKTEDDDEEEGGADGGTDSHGNNN